jgi:hypothetical protein
LRVSGQPGSNVSASAAGNPNRLTIVGISIRPRQRWNLPEIRLASSKVDVIEATTKNRCFSDRYWALRPQMQA